MDRDREIPKNILAKAVKCTNGFSCVKDEKFDLCKVDFALDKDHLFVQEPQNQDCQYLNSFGNSFYCSCPVRQEIYQLYSH